MVDSGKKEQYMSIYVGTYVPYAEKIANYSSTVKSVLCDNNIFCGDLQLEYEKAEGLILFEDTILAQVFMTFGSLAGYQSSVSHKCHLLQSL